MYSTDYSQVCASACSCVSCVYGCCPPVLRVCPLEEQPARVCPACGWPVQIHVPTRFVFVAHHSSLSGHTEQRRRLMARLLCSSYCELRCSMGEPFHLEDRVATVAHSCAYGAPSACDVLASALLAQHVRAERNALEMAPAKPVCRSEQVPKHHFVMGWMDVVHKRYRSRRRIHGNIRSS